MTLLHTTLKKALTDFASLPGRVYIVFLILYLLAGLCLYLLISLLTERNVINKSDLRIADTLGVYAGNLSSEISRIESMPRLLAGTAIYARLLEDQADAILLDQVNRKLEQDNLALGTLDVFLLNAQGTTIASSNWNQETSFVGEDLSFRPYYSDAISNGVARYFALGTNSRKRGYYFSAAVTGVASSSTATPLGVIVVKAGLDQMEAAWAAGYEMVTVTDNEGIFFISSNPDWLYHSMQEMEESQLAEIAKNRRFPGITPKALDLEITEQKTTAHGAEKLLVSFASTVSTSESSDFSVISSILEKDNWTIQIWSDQEEIRSIVATVRAITLLGLVALFLFILLVFNKLQERKRQRKMQLDSHNQLQKAYGDLELRVDERTQALSLSNTRLQEEIQERKNTERDLHLAQDNLVHAAKMAAIGQMATSITHELSQPLGAVRTFADNASVYLERNQYPEVNNNLDLIARMADRMKDIMRHLKSFSRKTPLNLEPVNLQMVIDETLLVLSRRLEGINLHTSFHKDLHEVTVLAEAVRLQQVLTNLLSNAIDALNDQEQKTIEIELEQHPQDNELIVLSVSDNGPGISAEMSNTLFDPFHSSKTNGDGLGLGLAISHSIMREFKGSIEARESELGGARMTLHLLTAGAQGKNSAKDHPAADEETANGAVEKPGQFASPAVPGRDSSRHEEAVAGDA